MKSILAQKNAGRLPKKTSGFNVERRLTTLIYCAVGTLSAVVLSRRTRRQNLKISLKSDGGMTKPQFFPIPLKSRFSRPHFFLPWRVIFKTCEFAKIQISLVSQMIS